MRTHDVQAHDFPRRRLALLSTTVMADETVNVFSTSGCGCCIGWMKHLEEAGFEVSNENLAMADL